MNKLSPNNTKAILLLGILSALLVWFFYSFVGIQGILLALLTSTAMIIGAYWFSDKLILTLYHAKELHQNDKPMLYATVAYLAERAKIPRPQIFLVEENMPNAFALGRNPENGVIVVTSGLLDTLNKDELAGVIAHEIAHILHQDTFLATLAASVGGIVTLIANQAQALFVFGMGSRNKPGNNKLAVFLMSMFAPMVAIVVQMTMSIEKEYYADEKAAELCENAQFVSGALRKIERSRDYYELREVEENPSTAHLFTVNPLRSKKWKLLFTVQPPVGDRIERLECMMLD
ncbi:MAG: M48 family metalloprotease [Proteobacteria bacterium]|nr:M48 family metalloprotease [Pseudomonadota bacterium]